jgi:hypothetical protein
MKRLRPGLYYLGATFLLMAALAELSIYVENVRTRQRAAALLSATRELRLGESTFSTTQNIRIDFGAIREVVAPVSGVPVEQRYQILVSTFYLNNLKYKFPSLWQFGLRPSVVEVELRYKEEKLIYLSYLLSAPVLTSNGQPKELVGESVEEGDGREPERDFILGYRIVPSSVVAHGLQVRFGGLLTSRATEDERDAAFDFDLSCISSLRGCRAFCQMMPSVGREAKRRYENKEQSFPKEVLEDSACSVR